MPSFAAVETTERPAVKVPALLELSVFDRMCIHRLVGHKIARIEQELILQTLKCNRGNRTLSADLLGISVRSLRQKIRQYKDRGEAVPDPHPNAASGWSPPTYHVPFGADR